MAFVQKITSFLWFDNQAEEAARFYVSLFKNSAIGSITRYGKEGFEVHGRSAGSVMTVNFRLEGQEFTALNGGPHFKFTEAISFVVRCETQAEVDHYWDELREGGDERAQQCGWLKDKYGVSWQIVPAALFEIIADADSEKSGRVMRAMLQMKKLDLASLQSPSMTGMNSEWDVERRRLESNLASYLLGDILWRHSPGFPSLWSGNRGHEEAWWLAWQGKFERDRRVCGRRCRLLLRRR
jgi:predicted 3-demethylubiquinone-9 3-methyltransferase (glyoxalase superfamily)